MKRAIVLCLVWWLCLRSLPLVTLAVTVVAALLLGLFLFGLRRYEGRPARVGVMGMPVGRINYTHLTGEDVDWIERQEALYTDQPSPPYEYQGGGLYKSRPYPTEWLGHVEMEEGDNVRAGLPLKREVR